MKTSYWFLIIAAVALVYVFVRGGDESFSGNNYNYDRLAVTQGMSSEALALDLAKDLDVSLLPEIGKQVVRDGAQKGLKEQAFLEFLINEVSTRIWSISTIDLNGDDQVDPILVKPEATKGEKYVMLSIQVPAHDAYPLPQGSDQAAWKKVETIEVATMGVTLDEKALTVQAQGNQHVYPNQGGNHYVTRDSSSSFLSMYFAMRMMDWMFFPGYYGFWGPGYGYGQYYRPIGVDTMRNQRSRNISDRGYNSASSSSSSAIKNKAGQAPATAYGRAYSKTPPRSLNQLKTSASFQRRQNARMGSGGFGRGGQTTRSGGFGRGSSRSGFGGGGFRVGK